jgi:DNA-binding MarR family transcriptional regulator
MCSLRSEIKQTKAFKNCEEEVFLNLQRTAEALRWKESEFLKQYEVTPQQYNVLRILRGESGLSCREISERMVTRDPDMTKLLDRLESRGLVMRERDKSDRRIVVASITEEGRRLLAEITPSLARRIKALFAQMDVQRLNTLNDLLEEARAKAD